MLKTIVFTKSRNWWSRKLLEIGYGLHIIYNCIHKSGYILPNAKETTDGEIYKKKRKKEKLNHKIFVTKCFMNTKNTSAW